MFTKIHFQISFLVEKHLLKIHSAAVEGKILLSATNITTEKHKSLGPNVT